MYIHLKNSLHVAECPLYSQINVAMQSFPGDHLYLCSYSIENNGDLCDRQRRTQAPDAEIVKSTQEAFIQCTYLQWGCLQRTARQLGIQVGEPRQRTVVMDQGTRKGWHGRNLGPRRLARRNLGSGRLAREEHGYREAGTVGTPASLDPCSSRTSLSGPMFLPYQPLWTHVPPVPASLDPCSSRTSLSGPMFLPYQPLWTHVPPVWVQRGWYGRNMGPERLVREEHGSREAGTGGTWVQRDWYRRKHKRGRAGRGSAKKHKENQDWTTWTHSAYKEGKIQLNDKLNTPGIGNAHVRKGDQNRQDTQSCVHVFGVLLVLRPLQGDLTLASLIIIHKTDIMQENIKN